MNILFLYTSMNVGGAQKVIVDLANNIKSEKNNVYVAAAKGNLNNKIYDSIMQYDVPFNDKKRLIKCLIFLDKIIREKDINIIHSHHRYTTLLANIIKLKYKKIEVVHTEHSVFPDKNLVNLRGKNIIAVSDMVKTNLIKNGINELNIKVIYNGVKIGNLDEININYDDETRIGVIARLSKIKGHRYLIEAMNIIKKNYDLNIRIDFLGDGPEKNNIENQILSYKLNDKIKVLGNVDNVIDRIKEYDFFILPSEFEGLPISILEIMSCGKFVIATDVGGNREIINNGENGYLIESKSIEAIVDKVVEIYNNKSIFNILNHNAYETIRDRFNIDKTIFNHEKYYKGLYK